MMGPALFDLYSSNYSSSKLRRTIGSDTDLTKNRPNPEVAQQRSLNSISKTQLTEDLSKIKDKNFKPSSPKLQRMTSLRVFRFKYIGSSTLDKSYTLPMLPWIIADIKRQSICGESKDSYSAITISLEITDSAVKIVNVNDKQILLYHQLENISKFTQTAEDRTWFSYLYRDKPDSPFTIHIFQAQDENIVSELFNKMRDSTKEILHNQTGHGLQRTKSGSGLETILTYSNQYEVMYIGSIRMSQKRAHPTVIDEAIDKFKEIEDRKSNEMLQNKETGDESEVSLKSSQEIEKVDDLEKDQISQNEQSIQCTINNSDNNKSFTTRRFLVKVVEEGSGGTPLSVSPINDVGPGNSPSAEQDLGFKTYSSSSLLLPTTLIPNTQSLDADTSRRLLKELNDFQRSERLKASASLGSSESLFNSSTRKRSVSGDNDLMQRQTSLPYGRARLGSGGSMDLSRPRNIRYKNKTMLFLIGKLELCLISTDKHKIVLNKTFSNISHCSQGIKNNDHFGLICREPALNTPESYVIHVFRCQTERLVSEIMHSLKQAFSNAYQSSKNRTTFICETCPMNWFHRICCDVEGLSPEKAQALILHRIDSLPSRDRDETFSKCQGIKVKSISQQNELFMIALKSICETKQKKHSHSNSQEKGLLEKRLSVNALDNFKEKAKSSLSNTLESIFKLSRTESSESMVHSPSSSQKSAPIEDPFDEIIQRQRSNTLSELTDLVKDPEEKTVIRSESLAVHNQTPKKPLLNIFMKVGTQAKHNNASNDDSQQNGCKNGSSGPSKQSSGSWRQTIFNKIHINSNKERKSKANECSDQMTKSFELNDIPKKKTKQELRDLWKSAIKQQIILNKMENQNQRLQDDRSSTYDKRMKLDYDEIPNFSDATQLWDSTKTWDSLLKIDLKNETTITYNQLLKAIHLGVPRHKKGEIWLFLAEQHKLMCNKPCDSAEEIPYRQLLGQLTTQQHAILVDLGRTFPRVAYYAQALGSGQLSLYNLLKAYSLYDREVEYCQGLSFVAGVLLLHMNEDDSFEMMKYLLFHRGFRKQYKPEMDALQMQLYQLTRLLYDCNYRLYEHFENHEISPTLYAAPWFLTLFASQFSISFVARLFDIIFLMGIEAIFRVSLILLEINTENILKCDSFESIMEYLKESLPAMQISDMETVFEKIFTLDIKTQLDAYEVEYRVIQEELMHTVSNVNNNNSPKLDDNEIVEQFMKENRELKNEVLELTSQIHVHQSKCNQFQSLCDNYLSTIKRLELRVRACEDERDALLHSVNALKRRNDRLELESKGNGDNDNANILRDRKVSNHTPVFSISCHKSETEDSNEDVVNGEEDNYDDEIDINDDEDDDNSKEDNNYNRTQSDTSNLSI